MTKLPFIISFSALIFLVAPTHTSAEIADIEPSFHGVIHPEKSISSSSLDTALSNHGLGQMGHGFLVLSIVAFLALRKR